MEEGGGEKTPRAEEEVLPEEDTSKVLQISLVEERIKIQFSQVVIGLINKIFNVITVKNLVIMHMNAGRSNMTKEGKAQVSRPTPTLQQVQC